MRIGEVAAAAGVNVETLRYYERRGLLGAPARTAHGYRVYDLDTVRFVRSIKEAQGLGFSLAWNVAGAALAMAGWVSPIVAAVAMPLSSVTVVAIAWRWRTFTGARP